MKAKIVAVPYEFTDIDDRIEFSAQVKHYINEAMKENPDFILFPELITVQLASLHQGRETEAVLSIHQYTDFYLQLFSSLSRLNNVYIIGGSHISKLPPLKF